MNAFITLAGPGLSVSKRLDITVSVSATIEVDAVTAQRKAPSTHRDLRWLDDRRLVGVVVIIIGICQALRGFSTSRKNSANVTA